MGATKWRMQQSDRVKKKWIMQKYGLTKLSFTCMFLSHYIIIWSWKHPALTLKNKHNEYVIYEANNGFHRASGVQNIVTCPCECSFPVMDIQISGNVLSQPWCRWSYILTNQNSQDHNKCHIDGLVQDCSNSSALAMELLQSYTEPSILTCSFGGYQQLISVVVPVIFIKITPPSSWWMYFLVWFSTMNHE